MKQYILNGKNSLGQVDSHIEDYRTKEIMEERLSRIKETFRNNGRLVSLGEGQKHKYMMLGRLLSDCKYFLRNPYERHLYFPSIARHCKEMRQYWLELNIKPEWLSYKQIGRLEHKMNRMKTNLDRQFKKDRYGE
jgi:hypothetical protein